MKPLAFEEELPWTYAGGTGPSDTKSLDSTQDTCTLTAVIPILTISGDGDVLHVVLASGCSSYSSNDGG